MAGKTPQEHVQLRFRKANERLLAAVGNGGTDSPRRIHFLCECADEECHGTVEVYAAEWEAAASQHNHFLMEAGHQRSEGEEVVGHVGEYDVARKPD
jgi:predicted phosphoadenosine phosphosulfate sulfurtransferase